MFKKTKITFLVLLVFAMLSLVVAGCGEKQSTGRAAIQEAFKNHASIKSSSFEGSLKFHVDFEGEGFENDPEAAEIGMVLDILRNSELTFKGTNQLDPMQSELILDAKIDFQGMTMNINLPMIVTQEKIWVKIPMIAMLPELAAFQDKYLELDLKELSEMSGQPFAPEQDAKALVELNNIVMDSFFNNIGDDYFVEGETKSLPEGIDASRVVTLKITDSNIAPFIKTLVGKILPEILDQMEKSGIAESYDLTKEDIDDIKAELQSGMEDFDAEFAEVKDAFSISKADYTMAIDKQKQVPYTLFDLEVKADVPEEDIKVTFGMKMEMKQFNFNKTPEWEIGIPKPEEVVSFEELLMMQ